MNPGIRYVQGMNEILASLFYVFRNDPNEENAVRKCVLFALLFSNIWTVIYLISTLLESLDHWWM